jgi:hypothetical protein
MGLRKIFLTAAVILMTACAGAPSGPTYPMAGAVLELARDQGVKVVVSMYGSGTGVFIAPDLVLTAKHVVEPWFAAPEATPQWSSG